MAEAHLAAADRDKPAIVTEGEQSNARRASARARLIGAQEEPSVASQRLGHRAHLAREDQLAAS